MSLASPLLALIYRARSREVHLRLQVSFPNPSLLHTAGLRTFLVSRGLLRRCQLAGRGCIFMGFLPSWTPGRLVRRSRGVTPLSVSRNRKHRNMILLLLMGCGVVESTNLSSFSF